MWVLRLRKGAKNGTQMTEQGAKGCGGGGAGAPEAGG